MVLERWLALHAAPQRNFSAMIQSQNPFRLFPVCAAILVSLLTCLPAIIPRSAAAVQAQFPAPRKDSDRSRQKILTGQVVDKEGKGLAEAVVYLKNKKTLEIETHISDEKGGYRFSGLEPNTDFEVHAELKGASSARRTVSSLDDRKDVYLVLEIGAAP
jgi:carboxypeptidase family protein